MEKNGFKNSNFNEKGEAIGNLSLASVFWTFFRIGFFTLGGGLAMMPVMRHEIVLKHKWMNDSDFYSMVCMATAIPGAIAVNMAYFLGRRLKGKGGLIVAVFGTILPSFIVILFIAGMLSPYFYFPKVTAFLHGCSIAVVGQLAFASLIFSKSSLGTWKHFIACIIGIIIIGIFKMHPIWGLIGTGMFGFYFFPYKTD